MILNDQRKILFRGKRICDGEWVFGDLICSDLSCPTIRDGWKRIQSIYPKTIGQYTGFKDCNGKEIFEHDIVRFWGKRLGFYDKSAGRIVIFKGKWSVLSIMDGSNGYDDLCACSGLKVLGNVFDDFELLEDQV